MRREVLFSDGAIYRSEYKVTGFFFGSGEKSVCVIGSLRGNECQQLFSVSLLIKRLTELENEGKIRSGHEILVIPSGNIYSMNIRKRFWPIDNTDINRMFPGYDKGETTQRIAAGIFDIVKEYRNGIQYASFYTGGTFTPHIRMMRTGLENIEKAKEFSLPFVVLHSPRPFDTTTLNYNWQIWETDAFSIYTTTTDRIDEKSANEGIEAILSFLSREEIIDYGPTLRGKSRVVVTNDIVSLRTEYAGFFQFLSKVGSPVKKGETIAIIKDAYTQDVLSSLVSPCDGIIFHAYDKPLAYANTALVKIVPS